jgi:hypothetical protein
MNRRHTSCVIVHRNLQVALALPIWQLCAKTTALRKSVISYNARDGKNRAQKSIASQRTLGISLRKE